MIERITLNLETNEEKEIILVGTAHVSQESADLVRETITCENPDYVGVELCKSRYKTLSKNDRWGQTKIADVIKRGEAYLFLLNILLANFQRKIGDTLDVKPGSEMVEAINVSKDQNIPIALVDRDIQVTLKRAWGAASIIEKFKLFNVLISEFIMNLFGLETESIDKKYIENLKNRDLINELIKELGDTLPCAKKVLIDERDDYIASKILDIPGKKIIVVVGAGHLEGIKARVKEHAMSMSTSKEHSTDTSELETIPRGTGIFKFIKYIIPAIFLFIVIMGYHTGGWDKTYNILILWIIANFIPAVIFALLVMAHPVTIAAAGIASPVTSLFPGVPAGLFASYVESRVRQPKVSDFEGLMKINGLGDLLKNEVAKIMLIFLAVNAGSSIGAVILFPILVAHFAF